MKVYLLYRNIWDGCDSWDRVEGVFLNAETAEREKTQLDEKFGDDYLSYYIEEREVNQSELEGDYGKTRFTSSS